MLYHENMKALAKEEIGRRVDDLPAGWPVEGGVLRKEFVFGSFVEAFGFMAKLAIVAEKHDHHPDWSNSYNKVTISLTTHDAGGITPLDFELADYAEKFAAAD